MDWRGEEFEHVVALNDHAFKETRNHFACVPHSLVHKQYWHSACIDAPQYIALFSPDNGGGSESIRFIAFRTQNRFLQGCHASLAMSKVMNPRVICCVGARSSRWHQRGSVHLTCAANSFPNLLHWSGSLAITLGSLHFSTVQKGTMGDILLSCWPAPI